MSETDVRAIHGAGLIVEPHQYDDHGHYLKILSVDKTHAMVFETDGKRVTEFRAGAGNAPHYVEGCL